MEETIFNSPIERTKFILKWWSRLLFCSKVMGELILWIGTCAGPLLMLAMVMIADFYLVWKPAIFTFLPGSDFKQAFIEAKYEVARFFRHFTKYWHRHEIEGFEKLPDEGGALIVYYHASIPIDYLALIFRTYLEKGRLIRSVVDQNLILMPGAETLLRTFGCMPGGREEVIKLLKDGHLVGVAPGGGYEAQLASNSDYPVMWKQRKGFAIVAKEARVPIIPMFTENVREAYVNMESGMELWMWLYNKTNAPLTPLYGGFPVKLTTRLGDPIDSREFSTADDLRVETIQTMQKMIKKYQKLPGNVYRAIKERFVHEYEMEAKDDEDFIEADPEVIFEFQSDDMEGFSSSMESLSYCCDLDSGCGSVASADDFSAPIKAFKRRSSLDHFLATSKSFTRRLSSIIQLPNGQLVMLGAL